MTTKRKANLITINSKLLNKHPVIESDTGTWVSNGHWMMLSVRTKCNLRADQIKTDAQMLRTVHRDYDYDYVLNKTPIIVDADEIKARVYTLHDTTKAMKKVGWLAVQERYTQIIDMGEATIGENHKDPIRIDGIGYVMPLCGDQYDAIKTILEALAAESLQKECRKEGGE